MNIASALKAAEVALEKGNYNYCIKLLEPLRGQFSDDTVEIGKIRLLLMTAYMGQGENKKASEECKSLIKNKDQVIRQNARHLISIINAPTLPRPQNWSITIPIIEEEGQQKSKQQLPNISKKKKTKKPDINYPPTGSTKDLGIGFSLFVILILLVLTFILSGCVQINTDINLQGPSKINLGWDIKSNSGILLPWQKQFSKEIKKSNSNIKLNEKDNGEQSFISKSFREEEVNQLLKNVAIAASNSSGFEIKAPYIKLEEQNWLVIVKQRVILNFDLTDLPNIPGLNFSVKIAPTTKEKNIKSDPADVILLDDNIFIDLHKGQLNKVELIYWQWSYLGIGIICIIAITLISRLLQKLRLQMGFGFPELPP